MNNTKFAMCHYELIIIFLLYKSKQHRLILLLFAKNIQLDQYLYYTDQLLKQISLDCAVFGFHENQIKVLPLQTKRVQEWLLPGGFVLGDESLEVAASRVLKGRTGLDDIFLTPFHVFSDPMQSEANPDAGKC
jgi:hypothetical protein